MKIVCVGRNYVEHIQELQNETPKEPVLFMKPDSAILQKGNPFFIPSFTNDVHHEIELVVRICRLGKNIGERFAHRYYDAITVGIDFTARDVQAELKTKGLPWERAKAFDGSAVLGDFISIDEVTSVTDIDFSLEKNGTKVQLGNSAQMIYGIDKLIAEISKIFTLKIGDYIFTGTPKGVGKVQEGDRLTGYLGDRALLDLMVK